MFPSAARWLRDVLVKMNLDDWQYETAEELAQAEKSERERREFVDHLATCDGCSSGFPCDYARAQAAS